MIRGIILLVVALGLIVGAGVTLMGLLAPLAPSLEIVNHFRPFILGGFVVLFAIAAVFRMRRWLLPVSAFALLNGALFALPIAFEATEASTPSMSASTMKVISFNIWVGDRPLGEVERFLRQENADVVMLQEIDDKHDAALLPKLKDIYPHQLSCAASRACRLAILSRKPWADANYLSGSHDNPPLIWARFGGGAERYRIASIHNAWPFHPYAQASHTDWLIAWRQSITEPLLIAGDFNLTPFSWKLSKFAWKTGLKRYSTYKRSWPGHRYAPAFLIDHVFSTDAFRPTNVRVGPSLGSDHLPIIATVLREAG